MEKVMRIRVKGIEIVEDKEKQMGGQVYRFIGNEEVDNAESKLSEEWVHFSKAKFAPTELHFKFERLDIGKQMSYSLTREWIDDGKGWDSLVKRIRMAIE